MESHGDPLPLESWLVRLRGWSSLDGAGRRELARSMPPLVAQAATEVDALTDTVLEQLSPPAQVSPTVKSSGALPTDDGDALVSALADRLLRWELARSAAEDRLLQQTTARLGRLYSLCPWTSATRGALLRVLSSSGAAASLTLFAELLAREPPEDSRDVALALAPLVQRPSAALSEALSLLLDALPQQNCCAAILDVLNYATRKRLVSTHPATSQVGSLAAMLGGLVGRLGQIEEQPPSSGAAISQLRQRVAVSVDIAIGLCDALGQIGDTSAAGKLHQALALRHRRLRAEAAAALARLGDAAGTKALVELAKDPASRTRALAYLQELGQFDQAPADAISPAARAESALADWLSEPSQFGTPPNAVRMVEHRLWHWPGYEEKVDCYLVEYNYRLGSEDLGGVGIVGPVTYAVAADLADLGPDDIFACYAGWHVDHPEITLRPAAECDAQQLAWLRQQEATAHREGYTELAWVGLGEFLGELLGVAQALRAEQPGTLIVEPQRCHWFPRRPSRRPAGPEVAWWNFCGRRLLSTFNSQLESAS